MNVLQSAVAEAVGIFATFDAALIEERTNLFHAWCASLPGNASYNRRYFYATNQNCSDLSFLFVPSEGERTNQYLHAPYLAVLESAERTPYYANLHDGEKAHTTILGQTGAGKSFLVNFLVHHSQHLSPWTFILDLSGSYQWLTKIHGGSYLQVASQLRDVRMNPFALEDTDENRQFQFGFVKSLIGLPLSAPQDHDLSERIRALYCLPPQLRTLGNLARSLKHDLQIQLRQWVDHGQYSHVFDHAEDNLTLSRFQCFDFQGLEKYPQVLEPLLFYVLHRMTEQIYDFEHRTTWKVLWIDEAWKFLQSPAIAEYIREAEKTWRKLNASVILATQSEGDLSQSEIWQAITENAGCQIFLANPHIEHAQYAKSLHLTDSEIRQIRNLKRGELLWKKGDFSKMLRLEVGRRDYWLYTNSAYDNAKRAEAFAQYGIESGLDWLTTQPRAIDIPDESDERRLAEREDRRKKKDLQAALFAEFGQRAAAAD